MKLSPHHHNDHNTQREDELLDNILRSELRQMLAVPAPKPSLNNIRRRHLPQRSSFWRALFQPKVGRSIEPGAPAYSGFYLMCILRSVRLVQGGSIPC